MDHQNNEVVKKVVEESVTEDRLSSSSDSSSGSPKSRSSNFSFEDTYQLRVTEHGSFALDQASNRCNNATTILGKTPTLETPPIQSMERTPDASKYRIPSYVFARNKSNTPNQDWSAASNDSLFSIHTGNMSYTKDQFNWLLKSGELGMYTPGDIRKSGELPPPSPRIIIKDKMTVLPPDHKFKSGEQIIANHFKASSVITDNKPADIVSTPTFSERNQDSTVNSEKEDIKHVIEVKVNGRDSDEVPYSTSVSDTSPSFAFPVLAEIDREKSVNSGHSRAENQKKSSSSIDQEVSKSPMPVPETTPPATSWFSSIFCCISS